MFFGTPKLIFLFNGLGWSFKKFKWGKRFQHAYSSLQSWFNKIRVLMFSHVMVIESFMTIKTFPPMSLSSENFTLCVY